MRRKNSKNILLTQKTQHYSTMNEFSDFLLSSNFIHIKLFFFTIFKYVSHVYITNKKIHSFFSMKRASKYFQLKHFDGSKVNKYYLKFSYEKLSFFIRLFAYDAIKFLLFYKYIFILLELALFTLMNFH